MPGELEHSKRHRDVSTEQTWIRRWHRGAGTLIGGSEVTGLRVLRGGSRSSRSRNLELMRQASRSQGQEKGLCRRCGVLPSALPLRKSAFWMRAATQNALFRNVSVAECTFPSHRDHRMRFSVECAFPHLRKRRATSRKTAFCPRCLTEKRILCTVSHGKPHSGSLALTEKRTLGGQRYGKARSACAPHQKTHSACGQPRRMRFSVTSRLQSAPFRHTATAECAFPSHRDRRMRFSVECAFPHLRKRGVASRKSALWSSASRKSAFCAHCLTEKRTLPAHLTKRRTLHGEHEHPEHSHVR